MAEFDRALTEPAHAVFRVLDVNNDNQISLDELQRAQQVITQQIQRLRMPEVGGSTRSQSRQGGVIPGGTIAQPTQVAPAPSTLPAPAPGAPPQP